MARPEISYLLFHCWRGLDWYDPPCSHSFQDLFGTFAPPAQRAALPRAPFVRIVPGGRAPATYFLLIHIQLRHGGAQNIQTDIEPKSGRTFRRHCSATRFRVRIVCTQTNLKSGTYLKPPFAGPTPRVSPSDAAAPGKERSQGPPKNAYSPHCTCVTGAIQFTYGAITLYVNQADLHRKTIEKTGALLQGHQAAASDSFVWP